MKNYHLIITLPVIVFVMCTKPNTTGKWNCEQLLDENDYWSCEQLYDTTGLKFYPFVQYTIEEQREMGMLELFKTRQIPEDFLNRMTTKELFLQFVYNDHFSHTYTACNLERICFEGYANPSNGFYLNMFSELLKRPDAGHILLQMFQKVPLSIEQDIIDRLYNQEFDCSYFWRFLQNTCALKEVINGMTDEDVCIYMHLLLRHYDDYFQNNRTLSSGHWSVLYGPCNTMLKYQFKPFIELLETNEQVQNFMDRGWPVQPQELIINCIKEFINSKK